MNTIRTSLMFLALSVSLGCGSAMPTSNTGTTTPNPASPGSFAVSITSLSPASVAAGSEDFTLTIVGKGFPAEPAGHKDHPAVWWQPQGSRSGVYLSVDDAHSDATHVTATVPASLVENAGDFSVQIQIFFFADDTPKAASNSLKFGVTK